MRTKVSLRGRVVGSATLRVIERDGSKSFNDMSNNDQIILDTVLKQQRQQLAPELSDSEFFEEFASEQALKDYDLSYEEIRSGIVDGSGDGGIDAIYIIANGELVHEDSEDR